MASAKSTKSTGAGKTSGTGKAAGTGKNSSTSKTAHVMNLLRKSNVTETPPPVEATPSAQASTAPAPSAAAAPVGAQAPAEPAAAQPSAPQQPTQHVHPLITSIKEEAEVSDQIRNALEDALLLEEQEAAAPSKPRQPELPVQKVSPPPPVEEPEEAPDEEDNDSFEAYMTQSAPREPVQQPRLDVRPPMMTMQPAPPPPSKPQSAALAPAPTSAPQSGIAIPDSPVQVTNVMEILVDQKADKYMEMFGVCNCPRCRVDVRAIALNNLPPKYVTLRPEERDPRLTIYENRFNSAVIAQLLRACTQVMEAPHHDQW